MSNSKYPPLYININKELLNILLSESKNNFFNFLYYKTDYYFFKEEKAFYSKYFFKKYKKLSKEQAFEIYNETGFDEILNIMKNKDYKDLFDNYKILYHLNITRDINIPVNDLKLLLEISNLNYKTILSYEKNN